MNSCRIPSPVPAATPEGPPGSKPVADAGRGEKSLQHLPRVLGKKQNCHQSNTKTTRETARHKTTKELQLRRKKRVCLFSYPRHQDIEESLKFIWGQSALWNQREGELAGASRRDSHAGLLSTSTTCWATRALQSLSLPSPTWAHTG